MLHDLLCMVEQLARVLGEQVGTMSAEGLSSTDDIGPGAHLGRASSELAMAAQAIEQAARHVNDAWSDLSPVGTRDPQDRPPSRPSSTPDGRATTRETPEHERHRSPRRYVGPHH